jgi:hypothetical protein
MKNAESEFRIEHFALVILVAAATTFSPFSVLSVLSVSLWLIPIASES